MIIVAPKTLFKSIVLFCLIYFGFILLTYITQTWFDFKIPFNTNIPSLIISVMAARTFIVKKGNVQFDFANFIVFGLSLSLIDCLVQLVVVVLFFNIASLSASDFITIFSVVLMHSLIVFAALLPWSRKKPA